MSKEAYYFSHDTNARRDPKILAMRNDWKLEGYGWYWIIIEMLAEQDGYRLKCNAKWVTNAIAMELLCDANRAQEFINSLINDYELLSSDGEYFWSESLIRRMNLKEEKRQKRVEAGKKGAEKRWNNNNPEQDNSNAITKPKRNYGNAIAKDGKGKESKGKESKVKRVRDTLSFRDNVLLTQKEFDTLVEKYGMQRANMMLDKLDSYKGSSGKTYKDDYKAINHWVVEEILKKKPLTQAVDEYGDYQTERKVVSSFDGSLF
jgi:hypothetical protein